MDNGGRIPHLGRDRQWSSFVQGFVRQYPARHMPKAARVLAALKRDGWTETRRRGSHRVLVKDDRQRVWAYHEGVDLGGPAMARITKDYGYTLAELRKL